MNRRILRRTFWATAIVALATFTSASAQEATSAAAEDAVSAPAQWGLQFGVTNNLTLTSFDGATIGLIRRTPNNRAWRIGMELGGSFRSMQEEDSIYSYEIDGDENTQTVELHAYHMRFSQPKNDAAMYVGAGPRAWFERNHSKLTYGPDTEESIENTTRYWSAGVGGLFGAEWVFREGMAVHAEYSIALAYSSTINTELRTDYTSNLTRDTKHTMSGTSLGSQSVRFGLSVYF